LAATDVADKYERFPRFPIKAVSIIPTMGMAKLARKIGIDSLKI
jgi:hypothetical protein